MSASASRKKMAIVNTFTAGGKGFHLWNERGNDYRAAVVMR